MEFQEFLESETCGKLPMRPYQIAKGCLGPMLLVAMPRSAASVALLIRHILPWETNNLWDAFVDSRSWWLVANMTVRRQPRISQMCAVRSAS